MADENEVMEEIPRQVRPRRRKRKKGNRAQSTIRFFVFLGVFLVPMALISVAILLYVSAWGGFVVYDWTYALACAVPGIWFFVSLLFASFVFVVPDIERWVIFRFGRSLSKPKGPGIVLIFWFMDEIKFKVNIQDFTMTIRFNKVPLKASAGQGYILCDPEIQLFISYQKERAHLSVVEVRNLERQIQSQAAGAIREATSKYNVDQAQQRSPDLIADIEDEINLYAGDWGIDVRVSISDWNFPEDLVVAWSASEKAETKAKAQEVLANIKREIILSYIAAAKEALDENATRAEIGRLAMQIYKTDALRDSKEAGGALQLLQASDFFREDLDLS